MHLKKLLLIGASVAAMTCGLAAPAQAAGAKFWVHNNSAWTIEQVFADSDRSGGQRNLLGANGHVWPYDQTLTLKVSTDNCISNVGLVNENGNWLWIQDVNICQAGGVYVTDDDFPGDD